ncbi:Na+/proline symporter [Clostridium aceticum]|uniref:Na+/proline symporter n=1 Tax=Clostridium aceticum TaxID=84022 RepID=A0A0G3WH89_9CLOT|nr:sodium:solute symporter family protein [Clostridium aceticum]AKL96839.1 Na+/proline symporter [Clostridium aceticum]
MNIPLLIVIGYMIALILISTYSRRLMSKKDSKNYFFAGKSLPWYLVCVMVAGAGIGGGNTVGVAENAYAAGLASGWYTASSSAGALTFALLMLHKVMKTNITTVSQIFLKIFGARDGLISVIVQIIFMFGINSLQIIAGGAILTSLLPTVFSFTTGMFISLVLYLAIALIGGYLAASISNLINVLVIYIGLIIGVIASLNQYNGLEAIKMTLPVGDHWLHFTEGIGFSVILGWFIVMMLNTPPNQAHIQVTAASKDYKSAKKGMIAAAILMAPIGFLAAFLGVVAASQFPGLESRAMALPMVVSSLGPWIAGFVLSGLWAASVSTATGVLMGLTTIITKDLIIKFINPQMSEIKQVVVSKGLLLVTGITGFLVALKISSILGFLLQLATLFVPYALIVVGIFYVPKFIKQSTCFWTVLTGILIILIWNLMPSFRIVSQIIYLALPACLITMVLCNIFDKRSIHPEILYNKEELEDATVKS